MWLPIFWLAATTVNTTNKQTPSLNISQQLIALPKLAPAFMTSAILSSLAIEELWFDLQLRRNFKEKLHKK